MKKIVSFRLDDLLISEIDGIVKALKEACPEYYSNQSITRTRLIEYAISNTFKETRFIVLGTYAIESAHKELKKRKK